MVSMTVSDHPRLQPCQPGGLRPRRRPELLEPHHPQGNDGREDDRVQHGQLGRPDDASGRLGQRGRVRDPDHHRWNGRVCSFQYGQMTTISIGNRRTHSATAPATRSVTLTGVTSFFGRVAGVSPSTARPIWVHSLMDVGGAPQTPSLTRPMTSSSCPNEDTNVSVIAAGPIPPGGGGGGGGGGGTSSLPVRP